MIRETMAGACALALAAGSASAQFSDDFDSYSVGDICGQSTWQPWTPGDDVCGVISDEVFLSPSRSLFIEGDVGGATGLGDDTVHLFSGVESGQWVFSIQSYIPGTATGEASFILLNTFPAAATSDWSIILELNADFDEIEFWPSVFTGVPLITDEWVEIRVEFDLDADTADVYYGETLLPDPPAPRAGWSGWTAPGGQTRLQAVDLYAGEPASFGISGMFYDDVVLEEAGGCYADCDGSGGLDFFDFLCFQDAFAVSDPYADCDGSGSHDFFDFLCFQDEFAEGCL